MLSCPGNINPNDVTKALTSTYKTKFDEFTSEFAPEFAPEFASEFGNPLELDHLDPSQFPSKFVYEKNSPWFGIGIVLLIILFIFLLNCFCDQTYGQSIISSIDARLNHKKNSIAPKTKMLPDNTIPSHNCVVMFHSHQCPHCVAIAPGFNSIGTNATKFRCYTCDDKCTDTKPELKITGFPTFIAFANDKEIGRVVGAPQGGEDELMSKLEGMF